MVRVIALTFALSAASATALGAFRSNAFLSSDMRPDMVAHTLQALESEWKAQAHVAAECKTQGGLRVCDEAPKAMHRSCSKVVRAVILGSQGDSAKVSEYMTSVCSQKTISGWHQGVCGFLGQSMVAKMSANSADNRENYVAKADATCKGLWGRFVEEQTTQVANEAVAKAKAEKVAEAKQAEAAKVAQIKLEKEAKAKAKVEAEAKAKEEKEAEAARQDRQVEDAKIQEAEKKAGTIEPIEAKKVKQTDSIEDATIAATKSVEEESAEIHEAEKKVGTQVKQADDIEAQIHAAFKSAPDAKADTKIAADAKAADAKIQEKVKEADAVETNIQAAFENLAVALPNVAVVKK